MAPETGEVLAGARKWWVERSDAVAFLNSLPDDSVDLLLFSPPYEKARTYSLGEPLPSGQKWVDWMVEVFRAAAPKVKGLIACVCQGQTRQYRWSAVPALLVADLHRAGMNVRNPPVFHRVGIPGSGGPDWLRGDYEWVVCVTRPGRLPWSDVTACGHEPKWAPGGDPSHRTTSGRRVNREKVNSVRSQRGGTERKVMEAMASQADMPAGSKLHTKDDGTGRMRVQLYIPPAKANPGSVISYPVGGGRMGHPLAHENDAPFPLKLAEFFVKSFCPPGGVVADCFSGSATATHAAVANGRRFVGGDLRESQVDLAGRRMASVVPALDFDGGEACN